MNHCRVHRDMVGRDLGHIPKNATVADGVVPPRHDIAIEMQDKYDLALKFKAKYKSRLERAETLHIFKEWDRQIIDKFGFIPVSQQNVAVHQKSSQLNFDLLTIHHKIRSTNNYNFLDAQIQVPSQVKIEAWEAYLKNYWDKQLVQPIRYGFPLSFDNKVNLLSSDVNHSSAREFPEDIKTYIQEEKAFNAFNDFGTFKEPPIPDLYVSPFFTCDKPGASSRRVIMDLSFPHGASVYAGVDPDMYLGSEFLLILPSIDYITNKVIQFGKGSLIYKIDISRAFCHIKIDPADYKLLGLNFDTYYIDTCLPFGFRHGSAIIQCVSNAIRYMMVNRGCHVTNYIDDIIGQDTL